MKTYSLATYSLTMIGLGLLLLAGCQTKTSASQDSKKAAAEGAKYLLSEAPDGAENVIQVRDASKDGDNVVIVGRIGGSTDPWTDDRAAFSIVDLSLQACSDRPDDDCPTPWDYCCDTDKLPASTALVKVVNENGDLVKTDARSLLGVKELSTVVVKGKVERDDTGKFIILATGIHVKE